MTLARAPRIAYLAVCLIAALALLGFYAVLGRSIALPDAAAPGDKLLCVSYSPFAWDQSPFDAPFVLRLAQMDADLALLASRFECVRTYSMTGLEAIPDLARKHGLKLLLGAWINADPLASEAEIDLLITAAQTHPDVVQAVIVGNETLLRREVTAARLAGLIARGEGGRRPAGHLRRCLGVLAAAIRKSPRRSISSPSTCCPTGKTTPPASRTRSLHVGSSASSSAAVRPQGDPDRRNRLAERRPAARNRRAQPGQPGALHARFHRHGRAHGWHYNLIEAFDQPWKRVSEGTVGGYWGLFDAERRDKGVLRGPVSNLAQWPRWAGAALALFGAALLLAGRPRDSARQPPAALAGIAAGQRLLRAVCRDRPRVPAALPANGCGPACCWA